MCHVSTVTCPVSHVTCQLSAFSCQLSAVSCQLSPITCHLSLVTCHQWQWQCKLPNYTQQAGSPRQNPKTKRKTISNQKSGKNLPKKRVLCFAVLQVRSLTRSLQLSRFQSPTEGTAYPLIHTSADIATNRLNQALGADSVQIYPFVIHLIPITLEPIK